MLALPWFGNICCLWNPLKVLSLLFTPFPTTACQNNAVPTSHCSEAVLFCQKNIAVPLKRQFFWHSKISLHFLPNLEEHLFLKSVLYSCLWPCSSLSSTSSSENSSFHLTYSFLSPDSMPLLRICGPSVLSPTPHSLLGIQVGRISWRFSFP